MARLLKGLPQEFKEMKQGEYSYSFTDGKNWKEEHELQETALEALQKRATHVWTFPMAAPDYAIRGLQTKDVMLDMAWKRKFQLATA